MLKELLVSKVNIGNLFRGKIVSIRGQGGPWTARQRDEGNYSIILLELPEVGAQTILSFPEEFYYDLKNRKLKHISGLDVHENMFVSESEYIHGNDDELAANINSNWEGASSCHFLHHVYFGESCEYCENQRWGTTRKPWVCGFFHYAHMDEKVKKLIWAYRFSTYAAIILAVKDLPLEVKNAVLGGTVFNAEQKVILQNLFNLGI